MEDKTSYRPRYTEKTVNRYRRRNQWLIKLCLTSFILLVLASGLAVVQHRNYTKNAVSFTSAIEKISAMEEELNLLRAINPYQFSNSQLLSSAASNGDLLPGWVTRVYTAPRRLDKLNGMLDLGAFVLDQSKFHLSTHLSYGLDTPENALYRLNGLVVSDNRGQYQIGVRLSFDTSEFNDENALANIASCFARVDVNNKRVIEKQIRLSPKAGDSQMLTGSIPVDAGIHPISAIFYCDNQSNFSGEQVAFSMMFRAPGELAFKKSADSVFHIYKTRSS